MVLSIEHEFNDEQRQLGEDRGQEPCEQREHQNPETEILSLRVPPEKDECHDQSGNHGPQKCADKEIPVIGRIAHRESRAAVDDQSRQHHLERIVHLEGGDGRHQQSHEQRRADAVNDGDDDRGESQRQGEIDDIRRNAVLFTYDFEKIKKHAVQQDRGDCNQSEEPDGAVLRTISGCT